MTVQSAAVLLAAAIAFLIPLAGYALHIHLEAKRQLGLAQEKREQEKQQAATNLLENLSVLARAVMDEQVNLTEGSLRIRVLLDLYDDGRYVLQEDLQIFDQVHQRAKHLATHKAREELAPKERQQQDEERLALEQELEAKIKAGAQALATFCEQRGFKPPAALFVNAVDASQTGQGKA